jgi:hypothetical protein
MESVVPTNRADNPDQRVKETLSISLSLSLSLSLSFYQPRVRRATLDYRREAHPFRKGHRSKSRLIVLSHSKACNSPNSHKHPG